MVHSKHGVANIAAIAGRVLHVDSSFLQESCDSPHQTIWGVIQALHQIENLNFELKSLGVEILNDATQIGLNRLVSGSINY